MKTTTWNRESGHVAVVLFDNGTGSAVSTKVFKTKAGAEKFCTRIREVCGEKYENSNLPWETTNPESGEVTRNFRRENLSAI